MTVVIAFCILMGFLILSYCLGNLAMEGKDVDHWEWVNIVPGMFLIFGLVGIFFICLVLTQKFII